MVIVSTSDQTNILCTSGSSIYQFDPAYFCAGVLPGGSGLLSSVGDVVLDAVSAGGSTLGLGFSSTSYIQVSPNEAQTGAINIQCMNSDTGKCVSTNVKVSPQSPVTSCILFTDIFKMECRLVNGVGQTQ